MKKNKLNVSLVLFISVIILVVGVVFSIFYYSGQIKEQKNTNYSLSSEISQKNTELSNRTAILNQYLQENKDLNTTIFQKENFEKKYATMLAYINLADSQKNSGQYSLSDALYYDDLTGNLYANYNDGSYDYQYHKSILETAVTNFNKCTTSAMKAQKLIGEIDKNNLTNFWIQELNLRTIQLERLANVCRTKKDLTSSELSRLYDIYEINSPSLADKELNKYNEILIPAENLAVDLYVDILRQINIYWNENIYEID